MGHESSLFKKKIKEKVYFKLKENDRTICTLVSQKKSLIS